MPLQGYYLGKVIIITLLITPGLMGGVYKQVRSLSQEALFSVVAGTITVFFHLGTLRSLSLTLSPHPHSYQL